MMKEIKGPVLPGYKIYEYQLVLSPHEDLQNRIRELRKAFADAYQVETFLRSRPNILLVSFVQYQMMEERITNHLQTIAMGCQPVKITLKDYGSFPSHTVYIAVTSKINIQHLVKQIRTEVQRLLKLNDDNKPHFIMEPHITVAQKLKPWQYEKGWLEYSHKHFTGSFIADAMLLLKRPVGEVKYEIARRFDFQNLPIATKQGALFG